MKKIIFILLSVAFISPVFADQTNTQKTAAYFNQIKNKPDELQLFLNEMPKGGDLHVHSDGAVYAENLIKYSKNEGFCLDESTLSAVKSTQCKARDQFKNLPLEPALYAKVIDAWSMRNFPLKTHSGEQHFFNTFLKFEPLVIANLPKVIKGIANRAGMEHENYLEIMIGGLMLHVTDVKGQTPAQIGATIKPQNNLEKWREQLLAAGLEAVVNKANKNIKKLQQNVQQLLGCDSKNPQPGCSVLVRYQYFALRDLPLNSFYAQLVTAFAVANSNANVVGINIVMPENWHIALVDYTKQMKMIAYLHQVYPKVNITLHAGELTMGQVPVKDLNFHINQAINIAHAQRIGHGVDILYESHAKTLLKEMAKQHVDVEINLTSNYDTMGVFGKNGPLPIYMNYHVPITLSTDDEGIERTDLTQQFKQAVLNYDLSYSTIKAIVRNSITYSFIPGKSLWKNPDEFIPVKACASDPLGLTPKNKTCQQFLAQSQKARMQWKLEQQFNQFENGIASS